MKGRPMKKNIALWASMFLAVGILASCSDDDEPTCSADDDICTVVVTVCCSSETECTYMVGDTEYATLQEASQSASCTADRAPDDVKAVVQGFQALTIQAKASL